MNNYIKSLVFAAIPILLITATGCIEKVINPVEATYVKLDSSGYPLADQSVAWSDEAGASEANFNRWRCVLDETHGLIWEVKSLDDGELQDGRHMYTWYDANPATNGGEHGVGDTGFATSTGWQNRTDHQYGADDCYDSSRCDTEKYVEDINAIALCGATDWRLPTRNELASLIYMWGGEYAPNRPPGSAYIRTDYFPYISNITTNSSWWSSTTHDKENDLVRNIDFRSYVEQSVGKGSRRHIMLVRNAD